MFRRSLAGRWSAAVPMLLALVATARPRPAHAQGVRDVQAEERPPPGPTPTPVEAPAADAPSAPRDGSPEPQDDAAGPTDVEAPAGASPPATPPAPAQSGAPTETTVAAPVGASRSTELAAPPAVPQGGPASDAPASDDAAPSAAQVPPAVPGRPPDSEREGWTEHLELGALVDAYYSFNSNSPKPQEGTNRLRAFDRNNGFSLSWVGLDASYSRGGLGATADLRLGPSASVLAGDDARHGLQYVKQGFVTFAPEALDGDLRFDFGKMDAPFGVEVADSQGNVNYTRGFLYTLGRPRFHTGLVVTARPLEALELKVLAVNGWNNTIDDNAGKTFGLQVGTGTEPGSDDGLLEARIGYLVGPEQSDIGTATCPDGLGFDAAANACTPTGPDGSEFPVDRGGTNTKGLRHLIDAVVALRPMEALQLTLNGDYAVDRRGTDTVTARTYSTVSWFGVRLAGRYAFDEIWRVGLRGEYYSDRDAFTCGEACSDLGIDAIDLIGVTATGQAWLGRNLALSLDVRFDHAEVEAGPDARFPTSTGPGIFPVLRTVEPDQLTITLGAVAFTN